MLAATLLPAILAALSGPVESPTTTAATPRVWAGHHVVFGKRKIPVRGTLRTRMDTFVLATMVEQDGHLEIVEQPCHVEIAPVAGISVTMDARHVPPASMALKVDAGSHHWVGSAENGWQDQDIDGDGHPGMTVSIDAPICSGKLYVSQSARTVARLHRAGDHISGSTHVSVHQTILGAEGACLSALARDSREVVTGPRAYAPVPVGTTCEQLLAGPWPVKATREMSKQ